MRSPNFDKILFFLIFSYLLGLTSSLVIKGKMKLFVNEDRSQTLPKSETKFITYMQRSLTIIDQKNLIAQHKKTNTKELSAKPKDISLLPITQLPNNPVLSPLPTSPLPPPPPPSTTSEDLPSLSSMPKIIAKVEAKPSINLTLIGLIQSGNHSTALFSFDGNIEQIQIGQQIGSSGCTLVSVTNQQAIIRKNGTLYSVSVGQKF